MPISRIAIGSPGEASHPDAIKAAFAEFFSMVIFVFAGEGSGMAFSKISFSNISYSCNTKSCLNFFFFFVWSFFIKI